MHDRSKSQRQYQYSTQIASTALTNVLQVGLGFGTGVIAARFLGADGRGELAAIQLWPLFFAVVALLGIPEALVFFTAKQSEDSRALLSSGVLIGTISSILFLGIGFFLMPLLLVRQPQEVVDASRWFLLLLLIQIPVGMTLQVLRGKNDILAWNVLRVLPNALWLGILLVAAGVNVPNPVTLTFAYLGGLMLLAGPVLYVFFRRTTGSLRPRPELWSRLVRYGLPSVASSIPVSLNLRLDQMLLAGFFPVQALGSYVVAVSWGNALQPLVTALGSVLFPRVASKATSEESSQSLYLGIRVAMAITWVLTILLMAATPFLFPLVFGDEFGAAVSTAMILVAAGAVLSMNVVLEEGARGLGKPSVILLAEISGACVTGAALFFLIHLGIKGAALASLLGYSTVGVILVVGVSRLTKMSPFGLFRPEFASLYHGLKSLMSHDGSVK